MVTFMDNGVLVSMGIEDYLVFRKALKKAKKKTENKSRNRDDDSGSNWEYDDPYKEATREKHGSNTEKLDLW